MKKLFTLILCMIFLVASVANASAFLPPGTGGGENPPLPPSGTGGAPQQDVLQPFVLIQSSSLNLIAGSSVTITVSAVDSGGTNTGVASFVLKENENVILSKNCNNAASCDGSVTFARNKGTYIYTVDAVDASGNHNTADTTSPSFMTIVFQNRAPSTPALVSPANNSFALVSNPPLTWTASSDPDGDVLTYDTEIDGVIANVAVTSYTPNLADGSHAWRVRARDNENLLSGWSETRTLTVDTLYPQVINSNIPDVELGSNALMQIDVIEANLISVRVEVDGLHYAMTNVAGNTYAYTLNAPALGVHNVRYSALDVVGKLNNSVTTTFNVRDTISPTFNPVPSNQISELGQAFVYDINANDSSLPITYSIDNANFTIDSQGTIRNANFLPLGVYSFNVAATDTQNNTNTTAMTVMVQDTTKPVWNPLPQNQISELGSSFTYHIHADDLQSVTYSVNDAVNFMIDGNGTIYNSVNLALGNYNLTVFAQDPSANSNNATIIIIVSDTIAPAWSPSPSNQTMQYNGTLNYIINAVDLQAITYTISDVVYFVINAVSGLINSIGFLALGNYNVEVNATDASGNVNSTGITLTVVDSYAPGDFNLVSPANSTISKTLNPVLTWQQSAEPYFDKYVVQMSKDGFSTVYMQYERKGVTNTSVQAVLDDNTNSYWRVLAYDTSGNVKQSLNTFIYTTDNTAPSILSYMIQGATSEGIFAPSKNPVTIIMNASEPVDWETTYILDSDASVVWEKIHPGAENSSSIADVWNGTYHSSYGDASQYVRDGTYSIIIRLTDIAGNIAEAYGGLVKVDNNAPQFSNIARTSDPLYGDSDVQVELSWSDINLQTVIVQHNATGTWQNASMSFSGGKYRYTISKDITTVGSTIGWRSVATDKVSNTNTSTTDTFYVNNHAPYFSPALQDKSANVNRTFTYDADALDADGDTLTFTDNAAQFIINATTGVIIFTPIIEETIPVIVTVCDAMNCTSGTFTITVNAPISTLINSYLNSDYYVNETSYNVTGIYNSDIVNSNVSGTVNISNSYLRNATLVDSTAINCTILDSVLYGINCVNQMIDPSDVRYSNITGSSITESHIWYSNATNSDINGATIDNSSVDSSILNNVVISNNAVVSANSVLTNTSISNATITNATITNSGPIINTVVTNAIIVGNVITVGTIVAQNGTVYDASADGLKNLTDLINYAPVAIINASATTGTGSLTVEFNASDSHDLNIPGDLNDFLNYSWNFGDGANSTNTSVSHVYGVGTFTAILTVTDKFNQSNAKSITITVNSAPAAGSSASPSSGGGSGGCSPNWKCTAWTACTFVGKQTRTCTDSYSCGFSTGKPIESQTCTYTAPVSVNESITAKNETNATQENEGGKGFIAGIAGITGAAISDAIDFGKNNPIPMLVLLAALIGFAVVRIARPANKKGRNKKGELKKIEEEEEITAPLHIKVARHVVKHAKKAHKAVKHHAGRAHEAVKNHVKNAHKAIKHHVNHHVIRHVKNAHKAVKHHAGKVHEAVKNGLKNGHKAVKHHVGRVVHHVGNAHRKMISHVKNTHETIVYHIGNSHKTIKRHIKNIRFNKKIKRKKRRR